MLNLEGSSSGSHKGLKKLPLPQEAAAKHVTSHRKAILQHAFMCVRGLSSMMKSFRTKVKKAPTFIAVRR